MKLRILPTAVVVSLVAACGLTDIRPEPLLHGVSASAEQKGRTLLEKMASAHKADGWCRQSTAEAIYTDAWPGLRKHISMWPRGVTRLHQRWATCSDNGRVTFLDGGPLRLTGWGYSNAAAYDHDAAGKVAWTNNEQAKFAAPTMIYFLEFPARIHEADVVAWVGQKTREDDGRSYDLVFATWKQAEAQPDFDQYVAWLDTKTHQLRYLEYTVRDAGEAVGGFATYGTVIDRGSYTYFDGFKVALSDGGILVHEVEVRSLSAGPGLVSHDIVFPERPSKAAPGDKPSAGADESAETDEAVTPAEGGEGPASAPADGVAAPDKGPASAPASAAGIDDEAKPAEGSAPGAEVGGESQ